MNLDLSKSTEIFEGQTPTPTCLIKNCEEFGVFDDLNPFDKSFEAAATQKSTITSEAEDSLHTPQVFPIPNSAEEAIPKELQHHNSSLTTNTALDILPDLTPSVFRQISTPPPPPPSTVQKYSKFRKIAEKPSITISTPIEIIQPVIELQCNTLLQGEHQQLILGAGDIKKNHYCITAQTQERSSASLTPTSQLPIKERLKLKAILSSKSRRDAGDLKSFEKCGLNRVNSKTTDCLDRRRAAAARYRNKIKYEFKELRRQNSELRSENANLRERVQHLEKELAKLSSPVNQSNNSIGSTAVPIQLRIPPVHLVMNIPQLLITPTHLNAIQP